MHNEHYERHTMEKDNDKLYHHHHHHHDNDDDEKKVTHLHIAVAHENIFRIYYYDLYGRTKLKYYFWLTSGKLYTPELELDIYGWRRRRRRQCRMHTTTWNTHKMVRCATCYWCTKGSSSRQDQMEIDGQTNGLICSCHFMWCWCHSTRHEILYTIAIAYVCILAFAIVTTFSELNNKNNLAYHSHCWPRLRQFIIIIIVMVKEHALPFCYGIIFAPWRLHVVNQNQWKSFLVKSKCVDIEACAWTIKRIKLHLENIIQIYSYLFLPPPLPPPVYLAGPCEK